MAWVAIDRAVKAVEQFGLEGDLNHWKELRQSIHEDICAHGYNPSRKAFTQYYGSENLDASLLMIPLVGFLPPTDQRVLTTVELIQKELVVDGFVLRYHPDKSVHVDGLPPGEGSFLPCSFWLVDCWCLMERRAEARILFRRLANVCSKLGLLSEEYDVGTRRQLVTKVSRRTLLTRTPCWAKVGRAKPMAQPGKGKEHSDSHGLLLGI